MERALIDYCHKWAEHGRNYALEFLPDHLVRSERLPELFDLAASDSFFAALRRAFPDDSEKALKPVRTALTAAATQDNAPAMAEFALMQARRVAELLTRTPLDVLSAGNLASALELSDLREPGRAILWHMLVAAELIESKSRNDREAAHRTLLRLDQRNLASLDGWYGVAAAGLILSLASVDDEVLGRLSRRLLPGYGQGVEVNHAIHQLSSRLVERGEYRLALAVDEPGRDMVRAAIVEHLASRGDFATAQVELRKVKPGKLHGAAQARLAVEHERRGQSERALELRNSAAAEVRQVKRGLAEVALPFAELGYFREALQLLEDAKDRVSLGSRARALRRMPAMPKNCFSWHLNGRKGSLLTRTS